MTTKPPPLLEHLESDQLEQVLALVRQFKGRFAKVAELLLAAANDNAIEEHVARMAITNECLLLAAFMYDGNKELFLAYANAALEWAEANRSLEQPPS
jgi:hypothetical protein